MKPAKNRQKDKDARWTKKHGKSFYGYKNHVNADAKHKLIRRYDLSDAAVHDSQMLDALLTKDNTSDAVFGDSAYRSAETEATLKAQGFKSRIHVRAARGSSALEGQSGGEPEEEPPSRSRRARIWSSADLTGWPDRTDDRHRQSPGEDRIAEPRLQHPSPRDTRTNGRRMKVRPSNRPVVDTGPIGAASILRSSEKCSPIPALSQSRRENVIVRGALMLPGERRKGCKDGRMQRSEPFHLNRTICRSSHAGIGHVIDENRK